LEFVYDRKLSSKKVLECHTATSAIDTQCNDSLPTSALHDISFTNKIEG